VAARLALSFLCHQKEYIRIDKSLTKDLRSLYNYILFKHFFILLFLALAAYGQQTSVAVLPQISVAVLPSDGTVLNNDELEALTDKMREAALKVLPTNAFVLLKQDVVVKRLGGAEKYIKECSESSCIVDLGKKAQVDYVAQASVGKLGGKIRLKVELYNVRTEGLVGMLSDEAENVSGLLAIVEKRIPAEVFGKIPGTSGGKSSAPSIAGGIGGVQIKGTDYEFAGEKRYLASISSDPEGASLSFNGVPDSRCSKTPCNVELGEGNVRIIAALEQYEIADTTVSIKQNNQSIRIRMKANFGILEIKPAYSDGIGKNEPWSLVINGKAIFSFENRLSPNKYKVELSHRCYEAINFEAGINKDSREVFDIASHIKLKKGGLVLSAEADDEPVSEPVFVNGVRVGETPFSGSVPLCAKVEIGAGREEVNVKIKHNESEKYTHKMNTEERRRRLADEWKARQEAEQREQERRAEAEREEVTRTAWMVGIVPLLGGGVSLNMNNVDPNYFKSSSGQWNLLNVEFYKRNLKFFRLGMNFEFGGISVNDDAVRRMQPNVIDSKMIGTHSKINAFVRLYPANFLFLSGGVGWDHFGITGKEIKPGSTDRTWTDVVKFSTTVFPIGGGIFLNFSDDKNSEAGFVIETLYNIVLFQGRTAAYTSINVGLRANLFVFNQSQGDIK